MRLSLLTNGVSLPAVLAFITLIAASSGLADDGLLDVDKLIAEESIDDSKGAVGNDKTMRYLKRADLPSDPKKLERIKSTGFQVFQEMRYKGLRVRADGAKKGKEKPCLRKTTADAYMSVFGRRKFSSPTKTDGPFRVPAELYGQPGLIAVPLSATANTLFFTINKPARCYAYIDWFATDHPNPDRKDWTLYHRDATETFSLYYRDFPAGENKINLNRDLFYGVGFCPLDRLSEKEKTVVNGVLKDDKPYLQVHSMHDKPVTLTWTYDVVDQNSAKSIFRKELSITVPAKGAKLFPIDTGQLSEGVMYFIESKLSLGKTSWDCMMPYGLFPVPSDDESVREPIIPFGGYVKLQVNRDPEIYGYFLAATFYHFRKMGMNACVLGPTCKEYLDIAQRYRIKCVIRLGSASGRVKDRPNEVVCHPAVLTYMIGDEPHIGEKLDNHLKLYEELTKKYPQYRPITCTIYDGWAAGGDADPDLIFNLYLKNYKIIRFGRMYIFRKDHYGLTHPADYKFMLPPAAIFQGLEANREQPWWCAPPFFGSARKRYKPSPYWRIPTGEELKALMHLAVSHRCTGILGWGTHTHHNVIGSFFDGRTMGLSKHWAGKAVGEFGQDLRKGKAVIQQFSPIRIPVFKRHPMEVDVTARWLKDRQFCVYLVNQDDKDSHAAEAWVHLGPERSSNKTDSALQWFDEIESCVDVFTGKPVEFEKAVVKSADVDNASVFLKINVDQMKPAQGMLVLAKAKGKAGFPAAPDELKARKNVDAEYKNADF